jgi:preprotein translocase subunit SecE
MPSKKSSKKDLAFIGFIKEVIEQARQVTWPTKKSTLNMTLIVIGVSVLVGAYLGLLDYLLTQLMGLIL